MTQGGGGLRHIPGFPLTLPSPSRGEGFEDREMIVANIAIGHQMTKCTKCKLCTKLYKTSNFLKK